MDLDSLQQWIEALYYNVKVKKEIAEYQEHLLDDITQPWPFHQAPQSIQDSYKANIQKQIEKEEECSKLTEFDKELQTVNDILQEAKLLQEKGKTTKPKGFAGNQSQIKPKSSVASSNPTTDLKKVRETHESLITRTTRVTRKPLGPNSSRPGLAGSRTASSKLKTTQRGITKTNSAGTRSNLNKPVKSTSPSTSPHNPPQERRKGSQNSQLKDKQTRETMLRASDDSTKAEDGEMTNEGKKVEQMDFSKVKLEFNHVKGELELPPKTRKLLMTHMKLKDQMGEILTERGCPEEGNFIRNMRQANHDSTDSHYYPVRTLKSMNHELYHCIRMCTRAIKVAKGLDKASTSNNRQHTVQAIALASQTLDIVEELYGHLRDKRDVLSNAEPVGFEQSSVGACPSSNLQNSILSELPLHDLSGLLDECPYPASTLTYQGTKEVSEWVCEKLRHQFLLVEKDLLSQIFKTYFNLIDKMVETEKGDIPSSDLVHVLQNAYGLLTDGDILLPAYVAAE